MNKIEAYQYALDFFVKRNHSTAGQIVVNFSIENVLELANKLLEWSNPPQLKSPN